MFQKGCYQYTDYSNRNEIHISDFHRFFGFLCRRVLRADRGISFSTVLRKKLVIFKKNMKAVCRLKQLYNKSIYKYKEDVLMWDINTMTGWRMDKIYIIGIWCILLNDTHIIYT